MKIGHEYACAILIKNQMCDSYWFIFSGRSVKSGVQVFVGNPALFTPTLNWSTGGRPQCRGVQLLARVAAVGESGPQKTAQSNGQRVQSKFNFL